MTANLDLEIGFYRRNREHWIQEGRSGQWCLIVGERLVDFFPSFNEALQKSLVAFPGEACLIREVEATDRVDSIQHVFIT